MSDGGRARLVVRTGRIDLPVTIRDHRMRVVVEALGNRRLALDPGTYLVSVALPDGAETRSVLLAHGRDHEVDFGRRSRPAVTGERLVAAGRGRLPEGWAVRIVRDELGPMSGPVAVRSRHATAADGSPRIEVELLAPGLLHAEIDSPDGRYTVALPAAAERRSSRVILAGGAHSRVDGLTAYPVDELGQVVVRYLANEETEAGARLFAGGELRRLLSGPRADPIIAAAGGYLLLRAGALEAYADEMDDLADGHAWLPDGAVLAAAGAFARGRLDVVRRRLAEATARGMPIFTDGLAHVAARLRDLADAGMLHDDPLRRARAWYGRWTVYADFGAPTTTIHGGGSRRADGPAGLRQRPRNDVSLTGDASGEDPP